MESDCESSNMISDNDTLTCTVLYSKILYQDSTYLIIKYYREFNVDIYDDFFKIYDEKYHKII